MVKLTVGLVTKRSEPHIDWALQSLKNQSFKDFEYVIVDGYYNRPGRKEYVQKLIKDLDIQFPVLHIPDKASRWNGQRPCIANARNTVLLFANSQYIVHADDCCKIRPNWLERHYKWLSEGYLCAGSWIGCQNTGPNGECIEGIYGPEDRLKNAQGGGAGEVNNRWLYGGNFSYIVEAALSINGFDEIYDGEIGLEDMDFGERLARKGYRTIFDPTCLVEYHMSTHCYDKMVAPINRRLRSGVDHFSNEWMMEQLVLKDKGRSWTTGNTINLRGSRELFGSGNGFGVGPGKWKYPMEQMLKMTESWIDGNLIDWRDGKLISEKLKNEPKWE